MKPSFKILPFDFHRHLQFFHLDQIRPILSNPKISYRPCKRWYWYYFSCNKRKSWRQRRVDWPRYGRLWFDKKRPRLTLFRYWHCWFRWFCLQHGDLLYRPVIRLWCPKFSNLNTTPRSDSCRNQFSDRNSNSGQNKILADTPLSGQNIILGKTDVVDKTQFISETHFMSETQFLPKTHLVATFLTTQNVT